MRASLLLLASLLAAFAAHSQPQSYPSRPLKLIVADAPGSASDTRARQIGAKLGDALGQPVVIDNRPGGSMVIAAEAAARAAPDGYTLFMGNLVTHSLNPHLFKTLNYRPDEDFIPVTMLSGGPLVLVVNPELPVRTLPELIAYARAHPGKLSYGSIGLGSPGRIVMEQLKVRHGTQFEFIPYKATAQYLQDLLAGRLQLALNYWLVVGAQVQAGKLRAIAIAGPRRLEVAPDITTFAEAGSPDIDGTSWQGVFVPAGTPGAVVQRLHAEISRALQSPEIRSAIIEGGSEVGGMRPEEFAAYVRADRLRWRAAVNDAGVEPQ
ncbi:MAG TPA: tripartite tricarboxylate transporter substrate binding protein [Usitatibacter sp.]|nr:tripartite tricarboxylate transporter substrate binding protein [Usitatibacter sp.]